MRNRANDQRTKITDKKRETSKRKAREGESK